MMPNNSVTQLLHNWRAGDTKALEQLTPLVYQALHDIAQRLMSAERPGHTLQATALMHEAYVRLVDADVSWQNRTHFYALAATAMRRILVDHARERRSLKRGGDGVKVTFNEDLLASQDNLDLVDLDRELTQLASIDERKARMIELHYFGGLTYEELALVLEISPATVDRDLRFAKAWLCRNLMAST